MTLNKNWCSTNKIKGHFDIYYIAWSSFCSGLCRGVWSMSRLKGPFRQRLGVRRAHPTGPLSISYVIASMFSAWKNVIHFNGQWFDKINNHFWGFFFQHGGSWRRKSLIEDARFETVTNIEFAKRERTISNRGSIGEEEEEVFTQNGDTPPPVETDPSRLYVILVTLKEGMTASLSRIVRVFEVSCDVLLTCTSETTVHLLNYDLRFGVLDEQISYSKKVLDTV